MILSRKYNLDVVCGGMPSVIRMSKNDSSSVVTLSLYAGSGKLDIPSGAQAYLRGRVLSEDILCVYSSDAGIPTVEITLSREITGKAGKRPFELVLKADEDGREYTLVTATFIFDIR